MRIVVLTILILIIFFTGVLYLNHYINDSSREIIASIEKVDAAIEENNWEKVKIEMEELKRNWNTNKKVWQIFLEHYEIDAIELSLNKIERYVELEEQVFALGQVTELKFLVNQVVKKEAFRLSNIF